MFTLAQVKRNKEFIATSIQEIFNPFQVAQVSQPIDLQKLFMHQLQQQTVPPTQMMQPQPAEVPLANGTATNPLLNGCTTLMTSTNINVTYLNGSIINGANKQFEADKFKMHQGFIAVLKVCCCCFVCLPSDHNRIHFPQDNFGFIETLEHDQEVFFHFSNFIGNTNHLELGQEVEYSLTASRNGITGGNCIPAENVRLLPRGESHQKVLMR